RRRSSAGAAGSICPRQRSSPRARARRPPLPSRGASSAARSANSVSWSDLSSARLSNGRVEFDSRPAVAERIALGRFHDDAGQPVIIRYRGGDNLVDGRRIVELQLAAQGVREHLFGETTDELFLAREQQVFQFDYA